MVTRNVSVLITGSAAELDAALAGAAAKADASASALGDSFAGAGERTGGVFERLGQQLENLGIPGAAAFEKIGSKVSEADTKGQKFGQTMSTLGGVTLAAGAAGFAVVAAEAVHLGEKFQSTVTTIAANANIPVAAAQKIGNAFLDTAGTTIYSGQEIATAYAGVAGQLGSTAGHALNASEAMKVMNAAMDLAEGSGTSLGSATDDLAKIMQIYGIGVRGAAGASDVLFSSSRLTGNSVDALTASMTKVHAQLGVLTPPLGQVGGLLVDLAQHGESGRQGLSAVSTAMTTLMKVSQTTTTTQDDVKSAFDALPPSLRGLATALENGTMTTTQLTAATKDLPISQAAAITGFSKIVTASNNAAEALANPKMTAAQDELRTLGISVTDASGKFVGMGTVIADLQPKLEGMTHAQQEQAVQALFGSTASQKLLTTILAGPAAYDKATAAVERSGAAHEAAAKQQQTLQHQLETLKAAVEDYGVKLGDFLIPKLEDLGKAIAGVITWFEKHKAAAIAVAAVIGTILGAAVIKFSVETAGKMIGGVRDMASSLLHLGDVFTGAAGAAGEDEAANSALGATLDRLDTTLGLVASKVGQTSIELQAMTDTQAAADGTTATLAASQEALAAAFASVDEATTAVTAGMAEVEVSETGLATASEATGLAVDSAFGPIGLAIGAVVIVGTLLMTHWKQVEAVAMAVWGAIEDFFKRWWPEIIGIFTGGIGLIVALLVTHWSQITADVAKWWHDITSFFARWWPELLAIMTGGISLLVGMLVQHWQQISQDVMNWWNNIVAFFTAIPGRILGAVGSGISLLLTWGEDVINGIKNGAEAAWNAVSSFLGGLPGKVVSAIGSGLKVLEGWGRDLIQGIVNGIGSMAGSIGSALQGIFNSLPGISLLRKIPGLSWLATGGYVTKPTLAMIGENEPELVIPQSKLDQITKGVLPLGAGLPVTAAAAAGGSSGTLGATAPFGGPGARSTTVNVTAVPNANPQEIAAEVSWVLRTTPG